MIHFGNLIYFYFLGTNEKKELGTSPSQEGPSWKGGETLPSNHMIMRYPVAPSNVEIVFGIKGGMGGPLYVSTLKNSL